MCIRDRFRRTTPSIGSIPSSSSPTSQERQAPQLKAWSSGSRVSFCTEPFWSSLAADKESQRAVFHSTLRVHSEHQSQLDPARLRRLALRPRHLRQCEALRASAAAWTPQTNHLSSAQFLLQSQRERRGLKPLIKEAHKAHSSHRLSTREYSSSLHRKQRRKRSQKYKICWRWWQRRTGLLRNMCTHI